MIPRNVNLTSRSALSTDEACWGRKGRIPIWRNVGGSKASVDSEISALEFMLVSTPRTGKYASAIQRAANIPSYSCYHRWQLMNDQNDVLLL
jgi:hypothetical protein